MWIDHWANHPFFDGTTIVGTQWPSGWSQVGLRKPLGMHLGWFCRNPTLAKCRGEAQHLQSWGFGVLRDSRIFRPRQQCPKHLALRCSWCHWEGLET
jgi:hypothetical protein